MLETLKRNDWASSPENEFCRTSEHLASHPTAGILYHGMNDNLYEEEHSVVNIRRHLWSPFFLSQN